MQYRIYILLLLVGFMACNKGYDRMLDKKDYNDSTGVIARTPKILFLTIDGARGESVRDAGAPNLLALSEHAIYSWNSISDTIALRSTGWADLLTGVHKEKHGVVKNDFSNNHLQAYPVFFKYIKERAPKFRIAAYSSSDSLGQYLITDTDVNQTYADDDAAATQAILQELTIDTASMVFGQFSQVELAGRQYGYDVSVPEYKTAILQADENIGKILAALKQRKTFASEDWLVIITAGNGGPYQVDPSDDDGTILSNTKVNTFTIYYSPRYAPSFLDRPYTGNRYTGKAVRLYGNTAASAVYATIDSGKEDYNLGNNAEATIELKIKKNKTSAGDYSYTYPSVIGNNMSLDWWHNTGWNISLEVNAWGVHFGQDGAGFNMATASNISDGKWHDIAAVFVNRDNKRYLRLLTDGNFSTEADITGYGNFDTDAPLTLGYMPGNIVNNRWLDAYITEVKFWKAAIPDNIISEYVCAAELPTSHPYHDYLVGYWSCKDGYGNVFKDQSEWAHDFQIRGSYQWDDFSDLMCPSSANNLAQLVPQPVDPVRQILNWLQIAADTKWDLDGKVWVTSYVDINK
ncbi:alkaline phosphatase family protein [Chitinophaga sp.]|uniref:alkaline phosphatase family protein n=1 Tax=Chitinophaga sp. TaxID=1869181 RepID=UPI0031D787C9